MIRLVESSFVVVFDSVDLWVVDMIDTFVDLNCFGSDCFFDLCIVLEI